mmetsp:Transcript_14163/g.30903  ORF Transcript_14163/g.30903 Transcript_14163/m.30903 type:complete len:113 (+) Transcript_14163:94-432(+)
MCAKAMATSEEGSSGRIGAWGFGGFTSSADLDSLVMHLPDSPTPSSNSSQSNKHQVFTSSALRSPQLTGPTSLPPPLISTTVRVASDVPPLSVNDNDNTMDHMDIGLLFQQT